MRKRKVLNLATETCEIFENFPETNNLKLIETLDTLREKLSNASVKFDRYGSKIWEDEIIDINSEFNSLLKSVIGDVS